MVHAACPCLAGSGASCRDLDPAFARSLERAAHTPQNQSHQLKCCSYLLSLSPQITYNSCQMLYPDP
ncbi:hypothetical protein Y1Q_0011433 [Alligator mississippiensis]|uniref:Uncharacterized protein n=1 Tax=Alligator mississippiensis TaxID=8496 RepID=A0A151LZR2_ALLMI|nr:hypothetical protein Y1Q_0011433 [Alligator mississippiensis]